MLTVNRLGRDILERVAKDLIGSIRIDRRLERREDGVLLREILKESCGGDEVSWGKETMRATGRTYLCGCMAT